MATTTQALCKDRYEGRYADPQYADEREWLGGSCTEPVDYSGICELHYQRVFGKGQYEADHTPRTGTGSSGESAPDPLAKERAEAMAYIRDYTGRWDYILNLRADRKWGTKWFRLTDRMVEVVLASKAREAQWAKEREQKAAPAKPEQEQITEAGWYVKDGQVIKVQVAVHGSGRLYAKRLQVIAGQRGEWVYEPGLVRTLTKADALTAEEAAKMGSVYGVCMVCGAVLTDEESISAGIGPVCSGRLSAQEAAFGL